MRPKRKDRLNGEAHRRFMVRQNKPPASAAPLPRYVFCRDCKKRWRIPGAVYAVEPRVMCFCGSANVEVKTPL